MDLKTFKYKIWADERTLDAIQKLDKRKSQDSLSFVLQQVNHMVIVEELFKSRLLEQPAPHKNTNE